MVRELGMDVHTRLDSKCRTSRDLSEHWEPCSGLSGSLDGRGACGRMATRVYVRLSPFAVPLKLSQLHPNTK